MNFDKETYEAMVIDFIDGTLTPEKEREFLCFLDQNPDLYNEVLSLRDVVLSPDEIKYEGKEELFKSELDDDENFERIAVSVIEKEVSADDADSFISYVALHSERNIEYNYFKWTRLTSDESIKYPNKAALYKKRNIVPLISIAVAASMIGIIMTMWFFSPENWNSKQFTPIVMADISPFTMDEESSEIEVDYRTPVVSYREISRKRSVITEKEFVSANTTREVETLAMISSRVTPNFHSNCKDNPITLAKMVKPVEKEYIEFREFINQRGKDEINKLGKKSLSSLERLASDKINLNRNEDGKVKKFSFNSKYLAVSFPIRKKD